MNRLHKKIVLAWTFSLLTICGFSGSGATYYVATTGSDSNTGGTNDPFRWPQKGVDMARAGDKVIVRQGIYNCRVLFSSYSGSIDPVTFVPSYITMEGESGAIINGGYDVTGTWTRDYSFTGGSVYKKVMSAPFGSTVRPQNLFYNDKMILHISDDNMATGGSGWTRLNDPQSSTNWVNIGALHGSTTVGATVTTYLRFADNRDPNQGTIYVSPHRNYSFTPTITISGQDYIKIKGFSLPNSSISVLLSNGASNNVIERNDIYGATDGVYVLGSDTATDENLCHNNHIRYNNITLNFFVDLIYANITNKDTWVWEQFKHFSDNDREGVLLYSAGHGNKVYGNNIYKHWGGIQDMATYTGALANKDYCKQLDVFDNIVHDTLDDALEPTGGEIDAQWHDNYAYNCTAGLRLKGIEDEGGPMYVYRNRIYTPYVTGSTTVDIFFYAETTAKIYIYNNSLSGVNGFNMCLYTGTGFPNTWIINNICSAQRFWLAADRTNWELYMNAKFYNNWCGGQYWKNIHWPTPQPTWFGTGNIINDYVQYWSGTPSFTIPSNSPCKDVGLDLSVPWTLAGVNHNALPGMFKGVPSGDVSLDMGAFQYGRLIQSADASVLDVDALKSVDLNTSTRWAPAGIDTHLLLDLGETKTLTSLDINFKSAASRTYYFDLYTKTDGNYNLVTPTTENLLGDGYRHYDFTDHQARYILFVGNGSSYSANPNVNEVRPNF